LAAIGVACSGSAEDPNVTAAPSQTEVTIEGIAFDPDELTVEVGDTVTWVNEDAVDHTVTSGEPGEQGIPGVEEGTAPKTDGLFDEPLKRAGSTASFTFERRGTFVYFCRIHAAMKAVITVE
jgi:plastocyanin